MQKEGRATPCEGDVARPDCPAGEGGLVPSQGSKILPPSGHIPELQRAFGGLPGWKNTTKNYPAARLVPSDRGRNRLWDQL